MATRLDKQVIKLIGTTLKEFGVENESELIKDNYFMEDTYNLTTDTSSIKPTVIAKRVIPVIYAKIVSLNLYEVMKMPGPAWSIPKVSFAKEVTSAIVLENNQIKTTKISTSNLPMTAVKRAYRSILTSEALEDANVSGLSVLDRVIEYDIKDIANQIDEALIDAMVVGAAAGDTWWDINIPEDWYTLHPSMEYGETLYDAIVAAVVDVAEQKFNADFALVSPDMESYLVRVGGYSKVGDNALQGEIGRVKGLAVFSSLNMESGMMIIGEKKVFGVYGVYIPMEYRPGGYNAEYDRSEWTVRTRTAMQVYLGEAMARVILYDDYTSEEVTLTEGAGTLAHFPVHPTESLTGKDGDGETSLTIETWDSRTEEVPTTVADNTIFIDLETGAVAASSGYAAPTDNKVIITYSAKI